MSLQHVPDFIRAHYETHEWRHAVAVLERDFPDEWTDIIDVLTEFRLNTDHAVESGGRKSKIAEALDTAFADRGWQERRWNTKIVVDGREMESPTHAVDCFKNGVALEIEWSNKDPFYDRDLNNFRLLFDLRVISVGIIITKANNLAGVFKRLGIYDKYGSSTTWISKLLPRIEGGGGGGCPLLVFGITDRLLQTTGPNQNQTLF